MSNVMQYFLKVMFKAFQVVAIVYLVFKKQTIT
jgi:hypothetical protein